MELKEESHVTELNSGTDVSAQLKKIVDHLVFLEKKIDTLLAQSQGQPPFKSQGFGPRGYAQNRYRHETRSPYGQRNYGPQGSHGTRTAHYKKHTPGHTTHH